MHGNKEHQSHPTRNGLRVGWDWDQHTSATEYHVPRYDVLPVTMLAETTDGVAQEEPYD